jgi:NAD+ diphosphatase
VLTGDESSLSFAEARGLATVLPAGEAGIVAHGRSLIDWHRRHRFCSVCGTPTTSGQGGSVRKCGSCGASHFPRTDPVVIMVVHRGDQCVLAKRRNAPGNRYSCIAGYIDQGETIEEAVAREVQEEIGLRVDEVVYRASQPWPFPSTLMIGCFAHAATDAIEIDPNELGDARWFGRQEVLSALNAGGPDAPLTVPDRVAIAHHLIRAWAEGVTD